MEWSSQQQAALEAIREWWQSDRQVFRLFGYAGTGKSTLAQHIGSGLKGSVQYGAYTGKAALVMKRYGCHNATTIHSLIYKPVDKSEQTLKDLRKELAKLKNENARPKDIHELEARIDQERANVLQPSFELRSREEVIDRLFRDEESGELKASGPPVKLFIIDEVSMVNERMALDLLSFGVKILVLGDPAQLPPVFGEGYFIADKPDAMLTEIHRQAEGNPIISLATHVRQGNRPTEIFQRGEISKQEWLTVDQILCGKNATRRYVNHRIRHWLGLTEQLPQIGEKVICHRNNHEIGLLNGSIWKVLNMHVQSKDIFVMDLYSEDEDKYVNQVECHAKMFTSPEWPPQFWDKMDKMRANEFQFAYCITTHKAQGSQWPKVIYIDEWRNKDSIKEHRYTGITRAIEEVKVVRW